MTPFREPPRPRAAVLFVFGLGAAVLASPLRALWSQPDLPWWTPFAVWLALIGAGGLTATWWEKSGHD